MNDADIFAMPILRDPTGARCTWKPTERDARRAQRNHGQTLARLRERGGVTWGELELILLDRELTLADFNGDTPGTRERCLAELASRDNAMPGKIPVSAAQAIAKAHGLKQCLVIGFDGEQVHVTTYGETAKDCELAAQAQDFWTGRIREFSFVEKVAPHQVGASKEPRD